MTPWVHGYEPRDQYTLFGKSFFGPSNSLLMLLPWQSFPARVFYGCSLLTACLGAGFIHTLIAADRVLSPLFPPPVPAFCSQFLTSTLCVAASAIGGLALGLIPCAVMFVGCIYTHCRECCRQVRQHRDGDCTAFVKFKDPAMQRRYTGKRIDMETLYEMYFDQELDFVNPNSPEDTEQLCCLMADVLARRHEFVDYTFGISTHLRFLLMQWIPDVLGHSKSQDVDQVRDHYDRSTFYAQQLATSDASMSTSTPFTSDEAEDDFFGMFLGQSMVYTSGIVSTMNGDSTLCQLESLEQMQENKIKLICRKLKLRKGETHLDIGCGWGTLVNSSASKYGTVATGVTLSRNQAAYASAMSKKMKIKDHRTTFWCRFVVGLILFA